MDELRDLIEDTKLYSVTMATLHNLSPKVTLFIIRILYKFLKLMNIV